jgi:hypothetical protein
MICGSCGTNLIPLIPLINGEKNRHSIQLTLFIKANNS